MSDEKFSDNEKETITNILNLPLPDYRKSYSDRTAFLMAALCELSYIVWESRYDQLDGNIANKFQKRVIDKLSNSQNKRFLTDYVTSLLKDYDDNKDRLISALTEFNLEVDEELSWMSDPVTDTQAFIAFNDDYAVLVFRGTEPNKVKDIRTDTKADLITSPSKGMVHRGFQEAFNSVKDTINQRLNSKKLQGKPLYIAGHSLGGAIATIAARDLRPPIQIAACYTYGSPRVGNEEWINRIKSPIYRIVNAADSVTMLPPGATTIAGLSFITEFIPGIGDKITAWLSKFNGYIHAGNMRYLTNCPASHYQEVKLLYSVSFLYRIKAVIEHSLYANLAKDHSIKVYRKKLATVAAKRNNLTPPNN